MRWLDTPALNQLAPPWKNDTLGACDQATIGTDGCLITCFAMLAGVIPPAMNTRMIEAGNYYNGCLAKTFDVASMYPLAPNLSTVTAPYQVAPFPPELLQRVWNHVRAGNPAVACVDMNPATPSFDQHWVLLVGAIGTGELDFIINDPWQGWQGSFLRRFGPMPRALVRVALYGGARSLAPSWHDRQNVPAHREEVR